MTITSSTNAPLFVVVGSTGNQGRSVIDAIAADNKEYRVRGITRDTSKAPAQDLAKIGVEVVTADLNDAASVEKAFEGAEIVFGMTLSDYWTPNGDEQVRVASAPYPAWHIHNVLSIYIYISVPVTLLTQYRSSNKASYWPTQLRKLEPKFSYGRAFLPSRSSTVTIPSRGERPQYSCRGKYLADE